MVKSSDFTFTGKNNAVLVWTVFQKMDLNELQSVIFQNYSTCLILYRFQNKLEKEVLKKI